MCTSGFASSILDIPFPVCSFGILKTSIRLLDPENIGVAVQFSLSFFKIKSSYIYNNYRILDSPLSLLYV